MSESVKNNKKSHLLNAIAILISVVPASVATLTYFPLWSDRGSEYVFSGISLIFIMLSFSPLVKFLRRNLTTASSFVMWLIVFVIFSMLSLIAEQIKVISFVGFISGIVSAFIFHIANRERHNEED